MVSIDDVGMPRTDNQPLRNYLHIVPLTDNSKEDAEAYIVIMAASGSYLVPRHIST